VNDVVPVTPPPAGGKPTPPAATPINAAGTGNAVLISPGHADNSITIPLGYGALV